MAVFCRDCRHCKPDMNYSRWSWREMKLSPSRIAYDFADCMASAIEWPPNLVSGKTPKPSMTYCDIMRREDRPCGPEGKLFQPKDAS